MNRASPELNDIELTIYGDKVRINGGFDLGGLSPLTKIVTALEDVLTPSSVAETPEGNS